MKQHDQILRMVVAALLCAVGILIPVVSPVKVEILPASFTLGSHVAIFVAMFLSPGITAAVCVGTTLGFQLAGFPIVVVVRAASQIVFAVLGALWLRRFPATAGRPVCAAVFGLVTGVIHGGMEVLAVLPFYMGGTLSADNYSKGFFVSVVLLVGLGTVVHSLVDYSIARLIYHPLTRMPLVRRIAAVKALSAGQKTACEQ